MSENGDGQIFSIHHSAFIISLLYLHPMKKIHLKYLLFSVLILSCGDGQKQDGEGLISTEIVNNPVTLGDKTNKAIPEIKFEEDVHDFGKIIQGEKVSHSFRFKNNGNADLVISGVSASCGCTVPAWPKELIAAGDEGVINVVFDSEGKNGRQSKSISVITNSMPSTRVLNIVGEVITPIKNKSTK